MSLLERLSSFVNWPADVAFFSPVILANAGFMYQGQGDKATCPVCHFEIQGRRRDEISYPKDEHRRRSPQCSWVVTFLQPYVCSSPPVNVLGASRTRSPDESSKLAIADVIHISVSPTDAPKPADAADSSPFPPLRSSIGVTEGVSVVRTFSDTASKTTRHKRRTSAGTSDDGHGESVTTLHEADESVRGIVTDKCATLAAAAAAADVRKADDGTLQQHNSNEKNSVYKIVHEASISDDDEEQRLLEENRQLVEARTCKVCLDNEINTVFLPCGHLVSCTHCASRLRDCPVCRAYIRGTVKVFLS